MTTHGAVGQGILVVCPCGNGFFVPQRRAGARVSCTLCGTPLNVPAPRSIHQAAAGALAKNQNTLWEDLADTEGDAKPPAGERAGGPVGRLRSRLSQLRRPWLVVGGGIILVVAVVGAAVYRAVGAPRGWSGGEYISAAGGFAVRLPTGLTARRFVERRTGRLGYTFEGVAFADGTCVGVASMGLPDDESLAELPTGLMRYLEREYHGAVAVAEQCDIRLGRHPGRQVTYDAASGAPRKSYSRWFLVGNRVYDVAWITGARPPSIETVELFLNSFRLLDEPGAGVTLARESATLPKAAPRERKPEVSQHALSAACRHGCGLTAPAWQL